MEDGLLSLKWNNHKTTFFEILRVLREKANYTDATIAVDGKFYPVHKLVMSTCSEYFSEIFEKTPCKSPVIVLKDVRSQDMEALLDYMYLGEVNVNQNDLASLLKTAECLRIKGLAVPDEDTTKVRKAPPDDRQESPPPKRRRNEDNSSSAPRPVSPSVNAPSKTTTPSVTPPVQSLPGSQSQDGIQDSSLDVPPMVKVEMQEADDPDDYRKDNSYEGGSVNEGDMGSDFGAELSKAEHDPDSYGSGSYAGPSIQPGGDLPWDEGDSSSFPQEGFSGDLPAGQQPQGDWDHVRPAALIPVVEIRQPVAASTPTSIAQLMTGACPKTAAIPMGPASGAFTPYTASTSPRGSTPDLAQVAPADKQSFMCPVCGKQFGQPYNLRRHLTTHTGERPYRCPHCNYAASQNVHLEKHIRRIHLNNGQNEHPTGPAVTWPLQATAVTP